MTNPSLPNLPTAWSGKQQLVLWLIAETKITTEISHSPLDSRQVMNYMFMTSKPDNLLLTLSGCRWMENRFANWTLMIKHELTAGDILQLTTSLRNTVFYISWVRSHVAAVTVWDARVNMEWQMFDWDLKKWLEFRKTP